MLSSMKHVDSSSTEFIWPQPQIVKTALANPILGNLESKFLKRALKSGWIGANGEYSNKCENFLDSYFDTNSLLVSNGSVALILALRALGIGAGDEVLLPDLTYAATASSVIAVGATPVFCDVELDSWSISLEDIERKSTARTKAIIVVHLYGMPANLDKLSQFALNKNIALVEDCAESFGAEYKGKKVGTFGDIGTFSFFPNKLITSGEGGAVVTKDQDLHNKMKLLRGQGMSLTQRYYFLTPGFNFRITELQASILWAQLQQLSSLWKKRESSEAIYRNELRNFGLIPIAEYSYLRAPWIFTIRIPGLEMAAKLAVAEDLALLGVETRPVFYPLSKMPAFKTSAVYSNPNSDLISKEGISLPTGHHVSKRTYAKIIQKVMEMKP